MLLNHMSCKCAVTMNKIIFLPGEVVVLHIGVKLNLIPVCKTTPQRGINYYITCYLGNTSVKER